MLNKYAHKETWSRRGKDFLMEVVRWETMPKEKYEELKAKCSLDEGRFIWNVYCYIYPPHPLFNKAEKEDIYDCPIDNFHGGCTFSKWHMGTDSGITSKQYGCDYNHYRDDRFTHIENPERAYEVFADAEELFKELEVTR